MLNFKTQITLASVKHTLKRVMESNEIYIYKNLPGTPPGMNLSKFFY